MKSQFIKPKDEVEDPGEDYDGDDFWNGPGQGNEKARDGAAPEPVVDEEGRSQAQHKAQASNDHDQLERHPAGPPEILRRKQALVVVGCEGATRLTEAGDPNVLEREVERDEQRVDDDKANEEDGRREQKVAEPVLTAGSRQIEADPPPRARSSSPMDGRT